MGLAVSVAPVALALSACNGGATAQGAAAQQEDPLLAQALAPPLMTDPDLNTRNLALVGLSGGGPEVVMLPLFEQGADAIAAAKGEAVQMAGGRITTAPSADDLGNPALRDAVTALQRAEAIGGAARACAAKGRNSMEWSLNLPAPFAIYPRGHLVEAAGSDADGCRLRALRFVTPVEPEAVIDFYATLASGARFTVRHHQADNIDWLEAGRGAASVTVQARSRDDGLTDADVIVNGG